MDQFHVYGLIIMMNNFSSGDDASVDGNDSGMKEYNSNLFEEAAKNAAGNDMPGGEISGGGGSSSGDGYSDDDYSDDEFD